MKLQLEKFGTTLISRQAGKKALAALQLMFAQLKTGEALEIDFEGVFTFSPGWADEFLSPLLNQLEDRLVLLPSDNLSVQATLKILQEANKQMFRFKK